MTKEKLICIKWMFVKCKAENRREICTIMKIESAPNCCPNIFDFPFIYQIRSDFTFILDFTFISDFTLKLDFNENPKRSKILPSPNAMAFTALPPVCPHF